MFLFHGWTRRIGDFICEIECLLARARYWHPVWPKRHVCSFQTNIWLTFQKLIDVLTCCYALRKKRAPKEIENCVLYRLRQCLWAFVPGVAFNSVLFPCFFISVSLVLILEMNYEFRSDVTNTMLWYSFMLFM